MQIIVILKWKFNRLSENLQGAGNLVVFSELTWMKLIKIYFRKTRIYFNPEKKLFLKHFWELVAL